MLHLHKREFRPKLLIEIYQDFWSEIIEKSLWLLMISSRNLNSDIDICKVTPAI